MKRAIQALFIILAGLFIFSCGKKEPAAVAEAPRQETAAVVETETRDLTPVEAPEITQGIITFFSGDVFIRAGEEWVYADIGDLLNEEDVLRVDTASYCEVQFSDTALVRIEENTEIAIREIGAAGGGSQVGIDMRAGSVLCKVKKLSGADEFRVQTQTAVCGVRGTEFAVAALREGETVLAVKEGAVAVLPASVDVDGLKKKVGKESKTLIDIIAQLEQAAPVVQANQELSVDSSTLRETEEAARAVEQAVESIVREARDTQPEAEGREIRIERVDPNRLAELTKAVEQTKAQVTKTVEPPREVSVQNREKMGRIDKMEIVAIAAKETAAAVEVHKIGIAVEPREAEIALNGETVGRGSFSGIYPRGEELSFSITLSGFASHSMTFTVSEETAKVYTVRLPRTQAEPAEEDTEEAAGPQPGKDEEAARAESGGSSEGEPETRQDLAEELAEVGHEVAIHAVPRDAVIKLKGTTVGAGTYSGEHPAGEALTFSIERKGYEAQTVTLTVPDEKIEKTVTLTLLPVEVDVPVTNGSLTGRMALGQNRAVAADSNGVVTALSLDGQVLWRVATQNSPNENSFPVVSGNTVYFTGSKELVIINLASGEVMSRVPLDSASAHLFGRRVAVSGGRVYYPANEGIRIIDPAAGTTQREINIPRGSRMTPAFWNNRLIIADQQGSLLVINPESKQPVESEVSTAAVQPVALAPAIAGTRAVFSGRKGTVVSADLSTGNVLWERRLSDNASVFTDIVQCGNGLYVFSKGTIYGLSLENGNDLFPPITGATSMPFCSGNSLYFGTAGALAVRNALTGRAVTTVPVQGTITTQPLAVGSKIVAGTDTGHFLLINP